MRRRLEGAYFDDKSIDAIIHRASKMANDPYQLTPLLGKQACLIIATSIRNDSGNRIWQPAVGDGKVP